MRLLRRRWSWPWIIIGAILVVVGATWHPWYTPTTSAYVDNDTSAAVTLDHCSDSAVTLDRGQRQAVTPFADGRNAYCVVFAGASDSERRVGCLYLPMSGGKATRGGVAYVSATRPCDR